ASQNLRLLQSRCVAGALNPASSNIAGADINGPVIPAGQGGSDILSQCLSSFSNSGSYSGRTGSKWAIGHIATDVSPTQGGTVSPDWRFVRLNGVVPSFENVANGSYKFSVSSTIQWNGSYLTNPDKLQVVTELKNNAITADALGLVALDQQW